jgi:anthranilate synthase component 2
MHGKSSVVKIDNTSKIFKGLGEKTEVARYHSLAADKDTMPECLKITAESDDGEVMAVEHKTEKVYGLQFHPESILTPEGRVMLKNFLEI